MVALNANPLERLLLSLVMDRLGRAADEPAPTDLLPILRRELADPELDDLEKKLKNPLEKKAD